MQTIKPIIYLFPQFHAIPENDKFWGVNWTEWDNVRRVKINKYGQETLRPAEEVGYYNLLDYSARARQSRFLRECGFYGIAIHHYWFGRPVMERVLLAMLEDGQPDMPFMLNWANEPWTARWDGNDASKVLIKQEYGGIVEWRAHFDWMLPFFHHPNYVRVQGRVQMMVYNPSHMGATAPRMFAAWRNWAVEEGLGGIDVIETKLDVDLGFGGRAAPDAASEFAPRSGDKMDPDATHWITGQRFGRVFHRGAAVSWDSTPRHPDDGGAFADPFGHPALWKYSLLAIMRRMKLEPNPHGQENFFFINALNEWGEGNALEPSVQWGDAYGRAFREAVDMAAALPWRDDLVSEGERIAAAMPAQTAVDVCVVVRDFPPDEDSHANPFRLQQHLRSLRAQHNPRWRAVVLGGNRIPDTAARLEVLDAFDPRVVMADVPDEVRGKEKFGLDGVYSTDWVIENLEDVSPECARAAYLLVADGNNTYEETAFGLAAAGRGDMLGMNFVTRETMMLDESPEITWSQRCDRLGVCLSSLCVSNTGPLLPYPS